MPIDVKNDYISQAVSEGLVLGSYQFNEFKTINENPFEIKSVTIVGGNKKAVQKMNSSKV